MLQTKDNFYTAFFEQGSGRYHSATDDVAFDGNIHAYGAGVGARLSFAQQFYFDSILRAGRVKSRNTSPAELNYRLSVPYFGASLAIGQQLALANWQIDNRLAYSYTYLGGDRVLINDQSLHFAHSSFNKAKAQSELSYQMGNFQPFVKIKFDYKFNHKSKISTLSDENGISLSTKGASVGAEIGLKYAPAPATQLQLGVGYLDGKQRETSAKLEFAYKF